MAENGVRQAKRWQKPGDSHLINKTQWGAEEIVAIERVLNDDWFGDGQPNREFEEELSRFTGIPYFNTTNSGSAALQVATSTLSYDRRLESGDKVLHPVTTFATSISSAVFLGMIPVFIETKPRTYVADPEQVERAIRAHPDIKGMILPHLLGNISDIARIKGVLEDRFLIEDCCDTMGGTFNGQHIGTFGDMAAFSFYGSHHITSLGVGGALGTREKRYADYAKSLIFWGRDFDAGGDFMQRYKYETIGTDSQLSAIQAAFAKAQMSRLSEFVKAREEQFSEMTKIFEAHSYFELPITEPQARPSWFAYPLMAREDAPFSRQELVAYLAHRNVETRPIMCGNILRQRAFKYTPRITLDNDKFPVGDAIDNRGLFVPCWGMPQEQRENYYSIWNDFLERYKSSYSIEAITSSRDRATVGGIIPKS